MRKKERFVLGKRTFRSQKSKHFVLRIIKIGTLIFLLVFSTITIKLTKIKNGLITFPQIIILCLCARVLVIPTFYTYTSLMAQTNLLCVLCFSMVIYLKK